MGGTASKSSPEAYVGTAEDLDRISKLEIPATLTEEEMDSFLGRYGVVRSLHAYVDRHWMAYGERFGYGLVGKDDSLLTVSHKDVVTGAYAGASVYSNPDGRGGNFIQVRGARAHALGFEYLIHLPYQVSEGIIDLDKGRPKKYSATRGAKALLREVNKDPFKEGDTLTHTDALHLLRDALPQLAAIVQSRER